ncbi:hypothetical protein CDD83_6974 [Cordyceps sp. RAO-2017]|nr:hypothetical protein CDD83_6974 [Cordyceps sp. RAO-2017]
MSSVPCAALTNASRHSSFAVTSDLFAVISDLFAVISGLVMPRRVWLGGSLSAAACLHPPPSRHPPRLGHGRPVRRSLSGACAPVFDVRRGAASFALWTCHVRLEPARSGGGHSIVGWTGS